MIKNNSRFEYKYNEGVMHLSLRGEIDHHSAAALRDDIDALLYELRPRRLLFDLSAVGFMDSSGLGLIMGRYSLLRELGGEMLILDPTEPIAKILSLAGIRRIIAIEKTKGEVKKNEE